MTWEEGFLKGMRVEAKKQGYTLVGVLVRSGACGRVREGIVLTWSVEI